MRTEKSIKNSIAAILMNIITMIIGFIAQALFIRILGAEYLGLNGLFSNILSMLSIAELGIGSAIIFNLYKPLAENDIKKINNLMRFYKKAYSIIFFVVLGLGILILPFLKHIVRDVSIPVNVTLVYILFLGSSLSSYVLSYKRSILYADQKKYIINYIHIIYLLILNCSQLAIIYFTKNYYAYLVLKIVCQLIENIIISSIVNRKYTFLNVKESNELDKNMRKSIFTKMKGLIFHKVGAFLVWGTDNILISTFFGVISVGIYSNYSLIINAMTNLFYQLINATTASIGNLLVERNKEKSFETFEKIDFINFCIVTWSAITFLLVVQIFITLWVGNQYILPLPIVIVLVISYYQKMMRSTYDTFKEAAGIWHEDRFVPILESIINISASVILLKLFGMIGVFLGTIVSGFVVWFYSYPKYVYRMIFDKDVKSYYKKNVKYFIIFIFIGIVALTLAHFVTIKNIWVRFFSYLFIGAIIPILLITIIFKKNKNFNYLKQLILSKFNKYIRHSI